MPPPALNQAPGTPTTRSSLGWNPAVAPDSLYIATPLAPVSVGGARSPAGWKLATSAKVRFAHSTVLSQSLPLELLCRVSEKTSCGGLEALTQQIAVQLSAGEPAVSAAGGTVARSRTSGTARAKAAKGRAGTFTGRRRTGRVRTLSMYSPLGPGEAARGGETGRNR